MAEKRLLFGTHIFTGVPMLAEAVSLAGYDMVWVDMEHTPLVKGDVLNCLIAIRAGGAKSYVRIPWNDPVLAKPILDMGPDGIIFPLIRSADDARRAVAACEYPPYGERGFGPMRASGYGMISSYDYTHTVYRNTKRVLQIEHMDAVQNLDEILAVEGVDGYIIGPNDLSGSYGHIGEPDCEQMQPVYDDLCARLQKAGVLFGVSMGYRPQAIAKWIERGIGMLFAGTDVSAVASTARSVLSDLTRMTGGSGAR